MKPKQITVTVKRVIQTDSFESSAVEITEVVELTDNDDAKEVREQTYTNVTRMVKKAIDNEFKKYVDSKSERERMKKKKRSDD